MLAFQMIAVESGLALEVSTNGAIIPTSRAKGDPFAVAKRNGWTFEDGRGTKAARRRALEDVVSIRTANDPLYTPMSTTTKALGEEDTARAVKRGQRWKATGEVTPEF